MEPNPRFTNGNASGWESTPGASSSASEPETDIRSQWETYFAKIEEQTAVAVGVPVTLPSGLAVRAKRPHIVLLLREGKIPDALTPLVEQIIAGIQSGLSEGAVKQVQRDYEEDEATATARFIELLDTVWVNAVVEPVFVRNPRTQRGSAKPGEKVYPVSAVNVDDKLFLFAWCQGVSDDLAAFRAGQDRIAEALSKGQNIFDVARSVARDTPRDAELARVAD